jgi:hypothetical protein
MEPKQLIERIADLAARLEERYWTLREGLEPQLLGPCWLSCPGVLAVEAIIQPLNFTSVDLQHWAADLDRCFGTLIWDTPAPKQLPAHNFDC